MFNFLKVIDAPKRAHISPSNKKYDPVVCIEVMESEKEQDCLLTCSMDGDLRMWSRNEGTFIKKFDINSFVNESVASMKVG